jgi:hypothetical protein
MTRVFLRLAYRLLLHLHPNSFQNEFGAEMLWIYDEEHERGGVAHLFFDGAASLLRQHCRIQSDPGQLSIASGAVITGPGIGPVRFLQAGITFSVIFFGLFWLVGHPSPFAVSVRWSDGMPCYTVTLQAPSHAEVVLETSGGHRLN